MKVLALVLSTVAMTFVIVAGSVLIVLFASPHSARLFPLALIPLSVFTYGPVLLGSLKTYWDAKRSPESRRYFAWVIGIVVGLDVIGAISIVVYAILASASVWLPVAFILVAAALVWLAFVVGNALRRRDERRDPTDAPWQPVDRPVVVRKIAVVLITFVAGLVVFCVLFPFLLGQGEHPSRALGDGLSFGFEFACLAAGIACVIVTLSISRILRGSLNKDLGRARRFMKVVLRGKNLELNEDEKVPAAKYAALVSLNLGFTLGSISLIYAGLLVQQLRSLAVGEGDSTFSSFYVVFLVVVLVVLFPLQIVRIRRARAYARTHADLLPSGAEIQPA